MCPTNMPCLFVSSRSSKMFKDVYWISQHSFGFCYNYFNNSSIHFCIKYVDSCICFLFLILLSSTPRLLQTCASSLSPNQKWFHYRCDFNLFPAKGNYDVSFAIHRTCSPDEIFFALRHKMLFRLSHPLPIDHIILYIWWRYFRFSVQ